MFDESGSPEGFDTDAIRASTRELLSGPVIYLPIRHHSPACARQVRSLITEHKPFAVLVEGPPSFDDQIELICNPAARMPLAIYSHTAYRFDPEAEPVRTGSYFPLCDYSPELVALRTGRSVGAELGFMDLDYTTFSRLRLPAHNDAPEPGIDTDAEGTEKPDRDPDQNALPLGGSTDETIYAFSAALTRAAHQVGCRDHNELWDQMVEGRNGDAEELFAAVLAYATLSRADATEQQMEFDGTHARESAMADRVVRCLQARHDAGSEAPIVVVTGAFHTVALPTLVAEALRADPASRSRGPEAPGDGSREDKGDGPELTDHGHGLIRYSFDRLDTLSGYGAGMPSPNWYQLQWDASADPTTTNRSVAPPSQQVITAVATQLRDEGTDGQPSVPSVVDALTAAEQLARLRRRPTPTRNDVIDAMVSCFTKGEDGPTNPVRRVASSHLTGHTLGAVPPGTPRVPLAKDFDRVISELGLPNDTSEEKQINLDVYRSEGDRRKSHLLHGLAALGVHYGRCIRPLRYSRAAGRDVIREQWATRLDGATDASLVEASLWGASVAEAVRAITLDELRRQIADQASSGELMATVMLAAQRGVHEAVSIALDEVRRRVAIDSDLQSIVRALTEAELIWTAREPLGGAGLDALPAIANQLYVRACHLAGRLDTVVESEHTQAVTALGTLHRTIATEAWDGLDPSLFWDMLADLRTTVPPGRLRGAVAGLEWRGGRFDDDKLVKLVAGHVDPAADRSVSAAFMAGLIEVARESLWEVHGVVPAINDALGAYVPRDFIKRAPGLRSAFAVLTPRQTDRLAEAVQDHTGARANVRVTGIDETQVLRHADLSIAVTEQFDSDGLAHWLTEAADSEAST